jgi:hypothetical protein
MNIFTCIIARLELFNTGASTTIRCRQLILLTLLNHSVQDLDSCCFFLVASALVAMIALRYYSLLFAVTRQVALQKQVL